MAIFPMPHQYQKCEEQQTDTGKINICSFCEPDEILSLSFGKAFSKYARYNPIISGKETLVAATSRPDTNVTLAFTQDREIVGFAILEYPDHEERWTRVADQAMMEVSVIEVGRDWRSAGISKALLRLLTDHPLKEDRIFYMVGYSWTWDLDSTGIPPMTYRNMLISLFSFFGFRIFQTNEPNIMLRPENLFMAGIGANISEEVRKQFKLVRFNLD